MKPPAKRLKLERIYLLPPAAIVMLRKELELTRSEFAKLLGVSSWTIKSWSSGHTHPQVAHLIALNRLLRPRRDQVRRRGLRRHGIPPNLPVSIRYQAQVQSLLPPIGISQ